MTSAALLERRAGVAGSRRRTSTSSSSGTTKIIATGDIGPAGSSIATQVAGYYADPLCAGMLALGDLVYDGDQLADWINSGTVGPAVIISGAYLGGTSQTNADAFGTWRGRPLDVLMTYSTRLQFTDIAAQNINFPVAYQGSKAMVSMGMLPENDATATLQQGATGAYTSYFVTAAQNLVAKGLGSCWIRFGWEFNRDFMKWSINHQQARTGGIDRYAEFITYWRLIVNAMRSVTGANFKFIWSPGNTTDASRPDPALAYPGDAYVDAVMPDQYDRWDRHDPATTTEAQRWNFLLTGGGRGLTYWQDFAVSHGKIYGFAEWNVWDSASVNSDNTTKGGGGDQPAYMDNVQAHLANARSRGVTTFDVIFNVDASDGGHYIGPGTTIFPNAAAEYQKLWTLSHDTEFFALDQYVTRGGNQWLWPTTGHHEWGDAGASGLPGPVTVHSPADGYQSYFNSKSSTLQIGDPATWSYYHDLAASKWRVIHLSGSTNNGPLIVTAANQPLVPNGPGTPLYNWFQQALQEASALDYNVLVIWSDPRYATTDDHHTAEPTMQPFWDLLYANRPARAIVLNSHKHNYERFQPMNNAGAVDTTKGIVQFVIGVGGVSHYAFTGAAAIGSAFRNATDYGVLQLSLSATTAQFAFINTAGAILDSGTINMGTNVPGGGGGGTTTGKIAVGMSNSAAIPPTSDGQSPHPGANSANYRNIVDTYWGAGAAHDLRDICRVRRTFIATATDIANTGSQGANDAANGIVTHLSCKFSIATLAAAWNAGTSSSLDSQIRSLALSMPFTVGVPKLTLFHEPEDDVNSGTFTIAQWLAAQKQFYVVVKNANPNIEVGPIHMAYQWGAGMASTSNPSAWIVPASFCDFYGVDGYFMQGDWNATNPPTNISQAAGMSRWLSVFGKLGKPLMVGEWGIVNRYETSTNGGGSWTLANKFTDAAIATIFNNSFPWLINNGFGGALYWHNIFADEHIFASGQTSWRRNMQFEKTTSDMTDRPLARAAWLNNCAQYGMTSSGSYAYGG